VGQLENNALEPMVIALGEQFGESNHDFVEYVTDLVLSEPFRYRGPEAATGGE
jgi:hypothetical protein